jgi:hypothetical protein
MIIALAAFGVAAWLQFYSTFLTFPLTGLYAVQMFAGMGIVVAGASFKKAKILSMVLIVIGFVIMALVYRVIL